MEDYSNTENGNVEGYENPEFYGEIISSMGGDVDIYGGASGEDYFGHDGYPDDVYGSLSENGSQSHSLTNDEVQAMSNSLKNHMHNLQVAFQGNHYDQNALDFLDECHRKGVELPSSVDHSSFKSESIVDRSVDGGFKSIDKTLIRDSLNNELEKGNLSKEEYDKLDSMLSRT